MDVSTARAGSPGPSDPPGAESSAGLAALVRRFGSLRWHLALMWCLGVSAFAANALKDGEARIIQADGEGYYAWARSIVLDGDVDFSNEFTMRFESGRRERALAALTPKGLPINKYSVGLPLVQLAPTTGARLVDLAAGREGGAEPGYGASYQWSVSLFMLTLGLWAIHGAFAPAVGPRPSVPGALLLLGGLWATNLVEYVSRGISFTHLVDVALIGTAWRLAVSPSSTRRSSLALGFVTALAVITRFTNVLVVPWLAALAAGSGRRVSKGTSGWLALGASLPLGAQLLANLALWGIPFPEPYPGERFFWSAPRLWDVLFSDRRGWLAWHPWFAVLLGLGVASWPWYRTSRAGRRVFAGAWFAVASLTLTNAAWSTWSFGFSFGNRGFLALLPVLTLTVAPALPSIEARWRGVAPPRLRVVLPVLLVTALVAWNAWVWIGFNVIVVARHGAEVTLADCVFALLGGRPDLPSL